MRVKLYVCNIHFEASQASLREWLTEVQGYIVKDVQLIMSGETGKSRGFAFVTFETEQAAREALRDLEGEYFMNRPLHVQVATAKPRSGEKRVKARSMGNRDCGVDPYVDEFEWGDK
jgi:RNA recognition motif-containing protein